MQKRSHIQQHPHLHVQHKSVIYPAASSNMRRRTLWGILVLPAAGAFSCPYSDVGVSTTCVKQDTSRQLECDFISCETNNLIT